MARRYPEGFRSFEEWDTYSTCVAKCMPGDVVHFYINDVGMHPTNRITPHTRSAVVAGKYGRSKYDVVLLLASNEELGFWRMRSEMRRPSDHFASAERPVWDESIIHQYTYGYWCYNYDMRIAKIELKRNETLPGAG